MWDHTIFIWVTSRWLYVHQTLTWVVINCMTNKGMTNGGGGFRIYTRMYNYIHMTCRWRTCIGFAPFRATEWTAVVWRFWIFRCLLTRERRLAVFSRSCSDGSFLPMLIRSRRLSHWMNSCSLKVNFWWLFPRLLTRERRLAVFSRSCSDGCFPPCYFGTTIFVIEWIILVWRSTSGGFFQVCFPPCYFGATISCHWMNNCSLKEGRKYFI